MNASRHPVALAAGLTILLASLPAAAQSAPSGKNALTIYGGYAWGGSFEQTGSSTAAVDLASGSAGALSIDWPYDAARTLQLFTSGQRSKLPLAQGAMPAWSPTSVPLNIAYVHLGGTNFFDGSAGQGGYVAGGLGATFLLPNLDGLSSEVRPSMSVALGYEQPLAPALSLRMELRGYATLIDSRGGVFCSGGCVVALKGDALLQGEALLGLSLRF